MEETTYKVNVEYRWTDKQEEAEKWLNEFPSTVAFDFECASKYTDEEKEAMEKKLKVATDWEERRLLEQAIHSDGLSHHSLKVPYHCSIASSTRSSVVMVLPTEGMRQFICDWIVTTDKTFVGHNLAYDLQIVKWYTGRLPKKIFDTMLMVKVLTNHVEKAKASIGLKDIMKLLYGDWAIAKEDFNLKNMYNEKAIKYNAIDACACLHLYYEIQESLCTQ